MRFCRSQFLLPEENIDFFEYPILFYHIREIFQTETAGKQKSRPCEQPDSPVRESANFFPCCPFPEKPSGALLFPGKQGKSPFFPVFPCPFPTGSTFLSCFPPIKPHFFRFQKCTLIRNPSFSPPPALSAFPLRRALSARRGHPRMLISPFSFIFLLFSPLSGRTVSFPLYAVLSRKDFPRPVNYFFTISTAPYPEHPRKSPVFSCFSGLSFSVSSIYSQLFTFSCVYLRRTAGEFPRFPPFFPDCKDFEKSACEQL